MSWFNLKFYISLSYCLPSFIIYTLLIIMLIRNWKDFKSAFFRIVIADFAFNLLTYLNSMLTLRLPNGTCKDCLLSDFFAAMGKDSSYTGPFLYLNYFLHFGNAYFQYSMVTLMSLNRSTSIFFFFLNEKIWLWVLPILIGIVVLITVYCTRTILQSAPYYTYYESLDMYSIKSDSNILPAYNNVLVFMAIAVSSSILLNIISVIKLKLIQNKISVVERNLLLVTIFSSLIQCFAAANTFILQIDINRSTIWGQFAQIMLPFSSDFLTIGQPYCLIFLSSKVRNGFLAMYWRKTSNFQVGGVTRTNGPASTSRSSNVVTTKATVTRF